MPELIRDYPLSPRKGVLVVSIKQEGAMMELTEGQVEGVKEPAK